MRAKSLWLLPFAALALISQRVEAEPAASWTPLDADQSHALTNVVEWQETRQPSTPKQPPQWTKLPTKEGSDPAKTVVWQDSPSDSDDLASDPKAPASPQQNPPTSQEEAQAALKALAAQFPSGPTFANDKAIWRDGNWHPQISNSVPVGFGPKGVMASFSLAGIDCTASGVCTVPATWDEYSQQLQAFGEAQWDWSLGVGDPTKWLGLTITSSFEETKLKLGGRNTGADSARNLFSNYFVGFHLSRALGPDTSIRTGVKNWIDVKDCGLDCGFPKSAYGVISQRIRLKQNQDDWFPNAYISAGIGNGEFRSLDEQFRASVAAQRAAGCSTYGYQPKQPCSDNARRRAVLEAANFGQLTPIASAALEVYPGFNAISEWSGRNLNLGFSVRPFEDVGLVFTSMWNNLIRNCDWGCNVDVPDYPGGAPIPDNLITYRPVWSFNVSLEFKF